MGKRTCFGCLHYNVTLPQAYSCMGLKQNWGGIAISPLGAPVYLRAFSHFLLIPIKWCCIWIHYGVLFLSFIKGSNVPILLLSDVWEAAYPSDPFYTTKEWVQKSQVHWRLLSLNISNLIRPLQKLDTYFEHWMKPYLKCFPVVIEKTSGPIKAAISVH